MTPEEMYNIRHPEKVCANPECGKKFRQKNYRQRYCCEKCNKEDQARVQREEREEDRAFKERKEKETQVSWNRMCELMRKHNLSYGRVEDAIRHGRIKA